MTDTDQPRHSAKPSPQASYAPLRVERSRCPDGTVVVSVAGEVDMATVSVFVAEMELVWAAPLPGLCIDASALGFIGAAGVDVLAEAAERAERHGTSMIVVGAPHCLRRVLRIAGLERLLSERSPAEFRTDSGVPPARNDTTSTGVARAPGGPNHE